LKGMSQPIPLEEIKKHSKRGDIWVAIQDKVYNLSEFINEHPGGEEVLLEVAGKDATTEFEDVGHSEDAKKLMKKYIVGDFARAPKESKKATTTAAPKRAVQAPPKEEASSKLILVPIVIILFAVVAYLAFGDKL